jgi:hypothetical protein
MWNLVIEWMCLLKCVSEHNFTIFTELKIQLSLITNKTLKSIWIEVSTLR